jgi:hypothetical protein
LTILGFMRSGEEKLTHARSHSYGIYKRTKVDEAGVEPLAPSSWF